MAWIPAARGTEGLWPGRQGRGHELLLVAWAPCQRGSSSHYGPGSSPLLPGPSASGLPSFACCGRARETGLTGGRRSSFNAVGASPRPECGSQGLAS